MSVPVFYIIPLGTVVRTRLLPYPGRVLVRVGQKVSPADVIAETSIGRKHVIINVADQLQVPAAKLESVLRVKRGQKVARDEVLGVSGGVLGREVRAPVDGRVVTLVGGRLLLETARAALEIRAGLSGTVSEVLGERGAVIRASGAVIQGVWGNGKVDAGVLLSLMEKPDDVLDPARLDVSLRGSVILAGHVADASALKNAADLPVRGLILSSLAPNLLSMARQAPYPIILLDGFGRRPMNFPAFRLLSTNVKRDVAVNAEVYDRLQGNRPEVFLSVPFGQEPPEAETVEAFAAGQPVRVISLRQPSQVGTILSLPAERMTLPNGVITSVARVRLDGEGEEVLVPLSNLEVLG